MIYRSVQLFCDESGHTSSVPHWRCAISDGPDAGIFGGSAAMQSPWLLALVTLGRRSLLCCGMVLALLKQQ